MASFIMVPRAKPISYGVPYTCSTFSGGSTASTTYLRPLGTVVTRVGSPVNTGKLFVVPVQDDGNASEDAATADEHKATATTAARQTERYMATAQINLRRANLRVCDPVNATLMRHGAGGTKNK